MKQLIIICSLFISTAFAQPAEVQWLSNINPQYPANSDIWVNTSSSVYPMVIGSTSAIALTSLLKKDKSLKQKAMHIAGALVVNAVATQSLKLMVNRDRPFVTYPTLINAYKTSETNQSFPSGHTSTAFAFATAVSLENKKWYVVAPSFLYAGAVGYSRMYLGEHYPSDVLAGAAVGIGSAYLNKWLQKKLFKH
jgi:membrane-associated phospholipid phosphatase